MSYNEAIEDNIRYEKIGLDNMYYPICHMCGKEAKSRSYIRTNTYTCKNCKDLQFFADKQIRLNENINIKEKKLENAILRIYKHAKNKNQYKKAINIVKSKLNTLGWFDSTEEIMVAIELLKNHIKFKHQVKMGRYRIDFILPYDKVVLEVDGTLFHNEKTKAKEEVRDNLIISHLGAEWEVVRITDVLINQNITKLVQAINKIVEKRKILRKYNNGQLPKGYTTKAI